MAKVRKLENQESIRTTVRQAYGRIAAGGQSCCGDKNSCGSKAPAFLARNIGYSEAELANLPEAANLGLSCGNPTASATLQPGETVLDLGSGGGFDVFIAARKVGPQGRVIGVDMTPEMLAKARRNISGFTRLTGLDNVEFRLGEIEHLPVADQSVDVVISNCVINLSPDKPQVWREIGRVLKPGGRAAISDLALRRPLPKALRQSVAALVGCIAGAVLISETEAMARSAGLSRISSISRSENIAAMFDLKGPRHRELARRLPRGKRLGDYVTSLQLTARKA
jgi:ubiquinone/menaquinone biosynthesis C-methylase UbiE